MQCNSGQSVIDVEKRRAELSELSSYIQTVDNDVTMILQSLQWDRKHLIESSPLISCKHDRNHRVPPDKKEDHEQQCYLRSLGYSKEDWLLPEPLDANASTLVTLSRGSTDTRVPLSLERLQHTYSADERRAFHDAVVSAAPSCHDLSELALPSGDGETQTTKPKSRAEIIAELRDMKRRRAKYRGAVKTRNYSDELRSVIATQMEHYTEALGASTKNKPDIDRPKYFTHIQVKKEPLDSDRAYDREKVIRRNSSRDYDCQRDKFRDQRDKSKDNHRRDKYKDETRYKENYRQERRLDRRDKYAEREKYDDYKRDRDDRRHKDDRDRYSSSSKDRNRDRMSDKYNDPKRNHKDYKSSKNSERKYKDEYDSEEKYKEDKHKRYYDYKEFNLANKRIKQEKD
ncbi:serine/threonine-protein kinase fray2-like isoform X2 [Leguminivora glycinivorella]|uniref:serine/threonine-protein kinase fray2-like isoform X2 n=1 Tax=Leguminivora glycinivorella TaxID=1035111 RepID=UPI00200C498F|nr:serine/threonine-protein kinase fray2-like isoform X2 [Leguminivora glycinivorella]